MTEQAPASGIDPAELDPNIRPQDDLYRHVNGKWIERTEIPADKARYGSFVLLAEEAEKAVRDIIVEAQDAEPGTEERKFGDLYASFLDEERIEKLGATPIADELKAVAEVASVPELLATLGRLERQGLGGFYQLFVDNDPGNPERYVVFVEQDGIALPDESYYREEQFAEVREAYLAHLIRMFSLAGFVDSGPRARRVFDLETEIAAAHWDNVRSRDSQATYNLYNWADAAALFAAAPSVPEPAEGSSSAAPSVPEPAEGSSPDAPSVPEPAGGPSTGAPSVPELAEGSSIGASASSATEAATTSAPDLAVWRDALGAPEGALDEIVLRQPSFTSGVAALLTDDRLDAWRDWLAWQVIHGAAPYLSSDFVEENFDFYGRTLTGTPSLRERWKRGVSLVEGSLGEAVGKIYVQRHFPPEAKQRMDVLVANLIEAYRRSIRDLDWMGEETRARALEKLESFTPKIGFPVKWRDYSALEIDPEDLVGNARRTSDFEFHRELGKIGKPLDRDEWFMTPQTINAYYNPGFNEIVFPAAILQLPFFSPDRDDAANYGAIGAVIGHEIGHGFDDQGSRYDGAGRLTDWWTEDDRAAFEKRTTSLIDQYNALAPRQVPDHHVNGALTIGENIGDLGGLAIAWRAYRISLGDAEPPVIDASAGSATEAGSATKAGSAAEEPPVIDGFTGAERFFLSWAQSWQLKARDEEVKRLLAIDPHSPSEFRCNQIVRNIDEFYEAFGVTTTDKLWLDPAERVAIW